MKQHWPRCARGGGGNGLAYFHIHLFFSSSERDRLQFRHHCNRDTQQNLVVGLGRFQLGNVGARSPLPLTLVILLVEKKKAFVFHLCVLGGGGGGFERGRNDSMFRFWSHVNSRNAIHNRNQADRSETWGQHILHTLTRLDHSIYPALSSSFYSLSSTLFTLPHVSIFPCRYISVSSSHRVSRFILSLGCRTDAVCVTAGQRHVRYRKHLQPFLLQCFMTFAVNLKCNFCCILLPFT